MNPSLFDSCVFCVSIPRLTFVAFIECYTQTSLWHFGLQPVMFEHEVGEIYSLFALQCRRLQIRRHMTVRLAYAFHNRVLGKNGLEWPLPQDALVDRFRTMSNVLMRHTFRINCRQMQRFLAHNFKQSLRRAPPASGFAVRHPCHLHSSSALAGTWRQISQQ